MKMTSSKSYIWELDRKSIEDGKFEVRHRLFPSNIVIPVVGFINYKLE